MTTELEEQFFKTFGIEPKYQDACTVEDKYWQNEELANKYGTFDMYMNAKCGNQENCTTLCSCAYTKEIYPEITDHRLLEMICIYNCFQNDQASLFIPFDINNVKDVALQVITKSMKDKSLNNYYCNDVEKLKTKIQQLFKGGGE